MKPEEALEVLNEILDVLGHSHYSNSREYIAVDTAIQAIEKQIPKKPERLNAFRSIGKCRGCEKVISTRTASAYCQYCGNKVDWGNDDET